MFTGLIEEIGIVDQLVRRGDGFVLTVSASFVMEDLKIGDSISIDGACQTVTGLSAGYFSVFVSPVTIEVTTLGGFGRGRRVNLERAMSHEARFGGHIVQGHVDAKGAVSLCERDTDGLKLDVSIEPSLSRYIVAKGSISVNGVSLTVVNDGKGRFSLYLIPETMGRTNLVELKRGDAVNIEVDILAKYVEKMLSPLNEKQENTHDRDFKRKLIEEGFGL